MRFKARDHEVRDMKVQTARVLYFKLQRVKLGKVKKLN